MNQMLRVLIAFAVLLNVCVTSPVTAQPRAGANLPDLVIKQYEFVSTNNKWVRVLIANEGKAASKPCVLELAVRKIKGVGATRKATETIPAIAPGKEEWITINTSGILQSELSLKDDATFRLRADETGIVNEADENNNETWHNGN